jgi:hypothetical protein
MATVVLDAATPTPSPPTAEDFSATRPGYAATPVGSRASPDIDVASRTLSGA